MEELDKHPNKQVTGSFIRQCLLCPSKDELDRHFAFDKCQQVMKAKTWLEVCWIFAIQACSKGRRG